MNIELKCNPSRVEAVEVVIDAYHLVTYVNDPIVSVSIYHTERDKSLLDHIRAADCKDIFIVYYKDHAYVYNLDRTSRCRDICVDPVCVDPEDYIFD